MDTYKLVCVYVCLCVCVCVCVRVCMLSCVQLFVTPWTIACQTPVHAIFQARILEQVDISVPRGFSQSRD